MAEWKITASPYIHVDFEIEYEDFTATLFPNGIWDLSFSGQDFDTDTDRLKEILTQLQRQVYDYFGDNWKSEKEEEPL